MLTPHISTEAEEGYHVLQRIIADRVKSASAPLFSTDVNPDTLWAAYLNNIPASRRQHYTCSCCRRFIERFGGVVTIDDTGAQHPILWGLDEVPAFFHSAIGELDVLVRRAGVAGVFLWGERESRWGTEKSEPKVGGGRVWTHLSGSPAMAAFKSPILTPGQAIAAKKEDFRILAHSLADFPKDVVVQAVRILNQDAVYRSEKAVGVANWFHELHRKIEGVKGARRDNLIWSATASAPAGFCHVRSTVISTLLDDIKQGLPFDDIARRWKDKLHPLQYQRPSAAPSDGAIEAAERLVEKLGVAKSLERRFAKLDDVLSKLWIPQPPTARPAGSGVFDHLKESARRMFELPNSTLTWEKFQRTVLPTALLIEVMTPQSGPYYGLVTSVDAESPPILQWDGVEGYLRNPVSWYFYVGGSSAEQWRLQPNQWIRVNAIFLTPHQWQVPRFTNQGENVFFALEGCGDTRDPGLVLFPEILKSEFHGIRAVIEAHSNKGGIQSADEGNANGIALQKNHPSNLVLRVTAADGLANYTIDRWD